MMSPPPPPIEQAAALYAAHGMVLARDLEAYLRHPTGRCIKTPDMLLLYRPVVLDDPARWLDHSGEANAWFVRLLISRAGLGAALREMPYPLPYCCWHRDFCPAPTGRLHVADTHQLIKKARHHHGRRRNHSC